MVNRTDDTRPEEERPTFEEAFGEMFRELSPQRQREMAVVLYGLIWFRWEDDGFLDDVMPLPTPERHAWLIGAFLHHLRPPRTPLGALSAVVAVCEVLQHAEGSGSADA